MRTPGSPPVHCQRRVGSHAVMRNVLRPSRLMCNAPDDDGPSGPSGVTSTALMCGAHSGQRRTSPNRSHATSTGTATSNDLRTATSSIHAGDGLAHLRSVPANRMASFRFARRRTIARTRSAPSDASAYSSNSQICPRSAPLHDYGSNRSLASCRDQSARTLPGPRRAVHVARPGRHNMQVLRTGRNQWRRSSHAHGTTTSRSVAPRLSRERQRELAGRLEPHDTNATS